MGTIAGNLMIKHQHNDFQSDLFVIFEAIGVTITIGIKNVKHLKYELN
jgi:xanthine dehydrogenase/oxidase